MSFEIPEGLTDLLQDFTVAVLKERPPDLVKFAADYFNKLNDRKHETQDKNRGVRFAASEPMQTDHESDDEPMPGIYIRCFRDKLRKPMIYIWKKS